MYIHKKSLFWSFFIFKKSFFWPLFSRYKKITPLPFFQNFGKKSLFLVFSNIFVTLTDGCCEVDLATAVTDGCCEVDLATVVTDGCCEVDIVTVDCCEVDLVTDGCCEVDLATVVTDGCCKVDLATVETVSSREVDLTTVVADGCSEVDDFWLKIPLKFVLKLLQLFVATGCCCTFCCWAGFCSSWNIL